MLVVKHIADQGNDRFARCPIRAVEHHAACFPENEARRAVGVLGLLGTARWVRTQLTQQTQPLSDPPTLSQSIGFRGRSAIAAEIMAVMPTMVAAAMIVATTIPKAAKI
jgi:hypothetical protein